LSWFINGSINRGQYTDINNRALVGVRSGNRIEELPDYNIKSGLSYGYDKLNMTLQASFIGRQFSDAANTVDPFVGVFGEIPSYTVFDYSAKYTFSDRLSVSASINNLTDVSYFTRRATAYPGPGIIPALGRTWNVTVHATF